MYLAIGEIIAWIFFIGMTVIFFFKKGRLFLGNLFEDTIFGELLLGELDVDEDDDLFLLILLGLMIAGSFCLYFGLLFVASAVLGLIWPLGIIVLIIVWILKIQSKKKSKY